MHIVYKITNKINNKIYVGVHNGSKPNYMGSGKLISLAIKKYGLENFEKRILYKTEHEILAYKLEEKIVTEYFIKRNDTYNLKLGGIGGRHTSSYTNDERKKKSEFLKVHNPARNMTDETKKKMSESHKGKSSPAKGNFKVKGDDKWKGCAHKEANNPTAKIIYIFNHKDELIYTCHGTFYKTLEEKNMPVHHFRKTLKKGKRIEVNLNRVKNKDLVNKYKDWYAKEIINE